MIERLRLYDPHQRRIEFAHRLSAPFIVEEGQRILKLPPGKDRDRVLKEFVKTYWKNVSRQSFDTSSNEIPDFNARNRLYVVKDPSKPGFLERGESPTITDCVIVGSNAFRNAVRPSVKDSLIIGDDLFSGSGTLADLNEAQLKALEHYATDYQERGRKEFRAAMTSDELEYTKRRMGDNLEVVRKYSEYGPDAPAAYLLDEENEESIFGHLRRYGDCYRPTVENSVLFGKNALNNVVGGIFNDCLFIGTTIDYLRTHTNATFTNCYTSDPKLSWNIERIDYEKTGRSDVSGINLPYYLFRPQKAA